MAQPLRRSAEAPAEASRLSPAPPPSDAVNGMESARDLLRRFEKLAKKGGTFSTNPEVKPYVFYGTQHLSMAQVIEDNLWKFDLSTMSRNVLDHLKTHHDDQALVVMTQSSLAVKFGCSQSKVSRAISQLSRHNFTWKERRGVYRVHPLYAYRWGSVKQRRLVKSLEKVLLEHEIVIPTVRNEATR
ncbi:replication/maintenance protein RepL [Streptomyces sp. NRRL WC-3744]|uniref:replication/maintenance protein RepL n=1 Tax=Streptomyces sp. NRRL WC-3744 TaxID=1463935 RepID=UPI0004C91D4F|nr:replication/maintenance protein RepL [Streptomyces sp. NRRL WC-3744]